MNTMWVPCCLFLLAASAVSAFASSSPSAPMRNILVTGGNKGQGLALCVRILSEDDGSRVFLCSRNLKRGQDAADKLRRELEERGISTCIGENNVDRIQVIQLDVTSDESVASAAKCVQDILQSSSGDGNGGLYGVVSNAGILWGYPLSELMDVCAIGVRRVCDAFLPMIQEDGRLIVVSSGLGPLMNGYSGERQRAMMDPSCTWEGTIQPMVEECLDAYASSTDQDRPKAFESIGFPGGPFAESAPDFHMYGLAKMFADVYMQVLARSHPTLRINSCDPGLVYTDLILAMPRYEGMAREETNGAQTPKMGVEAAMLLLFDENAGKGSDSGMFYAMSKDKKELLHSDIDKMPNK